MAEGSVSSSSTFTVMKRMMSVDRLMRRSISDTAAGGLSMLNSA
jgi:hypothetical protein